MAKMRVYELADTLEIDYARAVELLREVGAEPLNHMSVVERVPARRVRQLLKNNPHAAVPQSRTQVTETTSRTEEEKAPRTAEKGAATAEPPAPPPPSADPAIKAPEAAGSPPAEPSPPAAKADALAASDPATGQPGPAVSAASAVAAEKAAAVATPPPPVTKPAVGKAKRAAASTAPAAARTTAPAKAAKAAAPKEDAPAERKESPKPTASAASSAEDDVPSREAGAPSASPVRRVRGAQPAQGERPERSAASASAPPERVAAARDARQQRTSRATARKAVPYDERDDDAPIGKRAEGRSRSQAANGKQETTGRRRARPARERQVQTATAPQRPTGPLVIPESITVQELAEKLGIPATSIIKSLMQVGVMAAINQRIDHETAAVVAEKLGVEVERPEIPTVQQYKEIDEPEEKLVRRPPVVTIMGHVDHGKTTLLDTIRKTKVVEQEAGGITQHIGAYQVEVNGEKITFLDTPGHEAFTSMRSRGAQVTDIAVLVVAADDGVMPQTLEAISHARAANVPIMVAINKIDRPTANVDRVLQQLAEQGLVPEEWGGDTVCVPISALTGEGIDTLLEMILLVAELNDLKANPDRPARGVVIEAELDRNRGPVATVLVQTGTLRTGDSVVAGATYGRVRAMFDESGAPVHEAGPSRPVGLLGLDSVPQAGDLVEVVEDDRTAREIAEKRASEAAHADMSTGAARIRLSEIYSQDGEVKDLNLVLKADVQGSLEALRQSIEKLSTDEVRINIIHTGVGGINDSDVMLAAASNAIIIGFNVRPETTARKTAEREGIEVKTYRVIYEALDEIKAAMQGLLSPRYEEEVLGRAEVRALFRVPNVGVVAGAYVLDGKLARNAKVRVLRNSVVIHEGELGSLKRFKDDVREVTEGYECGLSVKNFEDLKEGDLIEAYVLKEVARTLE